MAFSKQSIDSQFRFNEAFLAFFLNTSLHHFSWCWNKLHNVADLCGNPKKEVMS